MTCEEVRPLLDAHLDRELDALTDREVVRHLNGCERCAREAGETGALKSALSASAHYFRAPAALRAKVERALADATVSARHPAEHSRRKTAIGRWVPVAIPAAVAALLALVFAPRMFSTPESDFLLREVVAAHIRSTQVDHLTDVASSDHHTVKPWFEGKIDFSPPVADFEEQGFKLIGGRVDYLNDRPVAALVYRHGPHVINVFLWPADHSPTTPAIGTRDGYNLDRFVHSGMNYWIVTDMSAVEVQKLAALLRGGSTN